MGQARTQPAFDAAALSSLACVPQLHLALWRAGRNCNRVKPGQQRAKTSRGKQSQNTGFCSMNSLGWPGCWETSPDSRQQVRVDLEVRQGGRRGCLHRLTCVLRHSCPGSPAGGGVFWLERRSVQGIQGACHWLGGGFQGAMSTNVPQEMGSQGQRVRKGFWASWEIQGTNLWSLSQMSTGRIRYPVRLMSWLPGSFP